MTAPFAFFLPLLVALLVWFNPQSAAASEVGELDIRNVLPLSSAERRELQELAKNDPEARALFKSLRAEAEALLDKQPQPLERIIYEGRVNTDPERIRTVKHLQDMDDAAALLQAWQASSDPRFARQSRKIVLAWARVYQPDGNDVNENKLLPLLTIYEAMRKDFDPADRELIDKWVAEIAARQLARSERENRRTNRFTKRVRLLAIIGLALDRQELIDQASSSFKEFVGSALFADGTSEDLKRRDTLTYHCSALRPLIDLAVIAARNGENLYGWEAPSGASLKKSVEYVLPYASGEKTREEWRNTTVELDRKRAAAGLEKYQPGSLFNPKSAKALLEEATYFERGYMPLVIKLSGASSSRFPTWRTVENEACRRAAAN